MSWSLDVGIRLSKNSRLRGPWRAGPGPKLCETRRKEGSMGLRREILKGYRNYKNLSFEISIYGTYN